MSGAVDAEALKLIAKLLGLAEEGQKDSIPKCYIAVIIQFFATRNQRQPHNQALRIDFHNPTAAAFK